MNGDEFQKTRVAIVAALNDPNVTAGKSIQYEGRGLILGNLAYGDPPLSMVAIDELGRLWKEVIQEGECRLVCVLDLRKMGTV